ncbi:MAG: MFS transporter, partial [Solirubrobacteraceae bacterium]
VMLASLCAGFGFTLMHTTVQTWATEVAPEARGTAVALFACMLFLGGGAATAAVASLASEGNFRLLFLVALVTTVPVVATLAAARSFFRPAGPENSGGGYAVAAGPIKIEPEARS